MASMRPLLLLLGAAALVHETRRLDAPAVPEPASFAAAAAAKVGEPAEDAVPLAYARRKTGRAAVKRGAEALCAPARVREACGALSAAETVARRPTAAGLAELMVAT